MKIKRGFLLREVGGTSVVVAIGNAAVDFRGVVRLNASAAELFKRLQAGAERDDLVAALTARYDVDAARAGQDVDALLEQLSPLLEA